MKKRIVNVLSQKRDQYTTLTSLQNEFVKHLVRLREDNKYRNESKRALIAGKKIVTEVSKVVVPHSVLFGPNAEELQVQPSTSIFKVTPEIMKKVTGLVEPEPYAAEVPLPSYNEQDVISSSKRILVLDAIKDPGNMGTLIRSAFGIGWDSCVLLGDCVDPFNFKAISSAKGASFALPIIKIRTLDEMAKIIAGSKPRTVLSFVSTPNSKIGEKNYEQLIYQGIFPQPLPPQNRWKNPPLLLLTLGNESHGVSEVNQNSKLFPSAPLTIEMKRTNPGGSINVASAGAILMQSLYRAIPE
eukprot:TRINITY_DN1465_c0_g1_i3.p1 TRINITY_DN1465_c0_g1~~TRINITY_DN1465_c0_g1_i3.p1  ORF type:complete len:299 (+),score=47.66 TRINITY_DN1465_c0_g1_i3:226-1122(+)